VSGVELTPVPVRIAVDGEPRGFGSVAIGVQPDASGAPMLVARLVACDFNVTEAVGDDWARLDAQCTDTIDAFAFHGALYPDSIGRDE